MAFLKGIYFGMSPAIFYSFVMLCGDAFLMCFMIMPVMGAVAKMIPSSVESAMFALFMGVGNLSRLFIAPILGNWINAYFGVTRENMDDLWKLFICQAATGAVPLALIWLLPKKT